MVLKKDFIERLSQKGYSRLEARSIMNDIITTLEETLATGESVSFRGFGTFEHRDRAVREAAALSTKERITIPPYRTVHFTLGKRLKREIKTGVLEV